MRWCAVGCLVATCGLGLGCSESASSFPEVPAGVGGEALGGAAGTGGSGGEAGGSGGAEGGAGGAAAALKKFHPGHYGLGGANAPQSSWDVILDQPNVQGMLVRYFWRDLEPEEGVYDLSQIRSDYDYLTADPDPAKKKRLSVMIMDRVFGQIVVPVPDYLTQDAARFDTGWFYRDTGGSNRTSYYKLWVPGVMDRLIALYEAIAAEFDGEPYFEHVYTEESALGDPATWRNPDGSTVVAGSTELNAILEAILDQRLRHLDEIQDDFRQTVVIRSINFVRDAPGRSSFDELFQKAHDCAFGTGNPDLRAEERLVDPFHDQYQGLMTLTTQVQVSAYDGSATLDQLLDYAVDELHLNHVYWLMADWAPIGPAEVIAAIDADGGRINDERPTNLGP